jgi:DNA sulfur modification protein DndE
MNKELRDNPNLNGYDYLIDKIETGLNGLMDE